MMQKQLFGRDVELALWVFAFATFVVWDIYSTSEGLTLMYSNPGFAFDEQNTLLYSGTSGPLVGYWDLELGTIYVWYEFVALKFASFAVALSGAGLAHKYNWVTARQYIPIAASVMGMYILVNNANNLLQVFFV